MEKQAFLCKCIIFRNFGLKFLKTLLHFFVENTKPLSPDRRIIVLLLIMDEYAFLAALQTEGRISNFFLKFLRYTDYNGI